MPYQLAFKSVGTTEVLACLVAHANLKDHFPDGVADRIVQAIAKIPCGYYGDRLEKREKMQEVVDETYHKQISEKARAAGITKSTLTILFSIRQRGCSALFEAVALQKKIASYLKPHVPVGTYTLKMVPRFGTVAWTHTSTLVECLKSLGEIKPSQELQALLDVTDGDFGVEVNSKAIDEYFAQLSPQSEACSACAIL